jgi:hypothetical protein
MPETNYIPKVGKTVFMSSGGQPDLITITGLHYDSDLEVMDYRTNHGVENSSTFKDKIFYPEVPVDTPYLYIITRCDDFGMALPYDAWFFSPEEAFSHIDDLPEDKMEYGVSVHRLN